MGFAIIMIMAFHTILPASSPKILSIVKSYGDIGVDIFVFVGGYTIAASLERSATIMEFYKKRLLRILPAYLLIWGTIHAVFAIRYCTGMFAYIKNLTLWNCIVNNNLTNWYIAAILLMYLLTPVYLSLCKRYTIFRWVPLLVIFCDVYAMFHGSFTTLPAFMFWNRLPIYLLGINLFNSDKQWCKINPRVMLFCIIAFILLSYYITEFHIVPNSVELRRFAYIPITVGVIYFFKNNNSFLRCVGGLTLELYLLHEFIQGIIFDIISPPWYVYIPVSIVLSFIFGYYLHRIIINIKSICLK